MAERTVSLRLQAVTGQYEQAMSRSSKATSDLATQASGATSKVTKVGESMQTAGKKMTAFVSLPVGAAMAYAANSASNLQQAVGGTAAVFGEASDEIERYAKTAARDAGLSETAFRTATTSIGGQLKRMTGDVDLAASKSIELTQVAADLAATYGGTTAEAVDALGAAFRGEADPAERFNLNLKQGAVNAKAVELGLAATTNEVSESAKAQATLALIMEQSADAQGQFARESDTAAGSMQIAKAEMENASAELGNALLPLLADGAGLVADLASKFSTLPGPVKTGIAALAGILVASGPILTVVGNVTTLVGKMKAAEGGATRFGRAMGALSFVGAVAGLAYMASQTDRTTVNVEELSAALADLTKAEEKELQQALLTAQSWGTLDDIVSKTADTNVKAAERLLEQAEAAGITGEELAALKQIIDDKRSSDVQASQDQAAYTAEVQAAAEATDEHADATQQATDAIQGYLDALTAQFDPLFGAQDAFTKLRDAQEAATEAQKEHGAGSREAVEANLAVTEAALGYESALGRLAQALETGDVKLDDAIATLQSWVDQGLITQRQADESAWALAGVAGAADSIPDRVHVHATAETAEANRRLQELARNAVNVAARVTASIIMSPFGGHRGATGGLVPGGLQPIYRAAGGPIGTDTVNAWLTPGEYVMQKSAVDRFGVGFMEAINSGSLSAAGGASSVVVNNQVVLNGSTLSPRQVADAVEQGTRRGIVAGRR